MKVMTNIARRNEMDDSPLSIGIIGAGEMVSRYHLPTLLSLRAEVEVHWLGDLDLPKAKIVARAFKVPVQDLSVEPSRLPPTDIVLVAIPYGARAGYWKSFRERASAVYLEKPIAQTTAEHRELCSWFPAHRLGCGYQRRSWGGTLMAKNLVATELFGPLERIRLGFGGPGITQWGGYSSNLHLAGGGVLFEFAVHNIDQMLFCTSATSVRVETARMVKEDGYDLHTEATLVLTVRERPVECQLTISRLADTAESLEFHFAHAIAAISFISDDLVIFSRDREHGYSLLKQDRHLYPETPRQTLHSHWSEFIASVRDGRPNRTSAGESILTTEVVEQLYRIGNAHQ